MGRHATAPDSGPGRSCVRGSFSVNRRLRNHEPMAGVSQQDITVGSSMIVGSASVDAGAVRGEGGPAHPQLIVPVSLCVAAR